MSNPPSGVQHVKNTPRCSPTLGPPRRAWTNNNSVRVVSQRQKIDNSKLSYKMVYQHLKHLIWMWYVSSILVLVMSVIWCHYHTSVSSDRWVFHLKASSINRSVSLSGNRAWPHRNNDETTRDWPTSLLRRIASFSKDWTLFRMPSSWNYDKSHKVHEQIAAISLGLSQLRRFCG